MKKKNILAENMKRFGTKNLTEVARLDPRFGKELEDIYRKLQQGEFVTDEIIDEMGDFYEEVYESGDLKLIQLYDNLRSVAEDEPEDQFPPVIALMKYLDCISSVFLLNHKPRHFRVIANSCARYRWVNAILLDHH